MIGKWRESWYCDEFPTECSATVRVMTAVDTSLIIVGPADIGYVSTKQSKPSEK
jgi:hypothetical protein